MDEKTRELRRAYDALMKARKDIRDEVREKHKEEYQAKVKAEVAERTRVLDIEFANKLDEARRRGMTRTNVAQAIRTNAHNRMKYFLDLAGSEGFTRGRPKMTEIDKLRQKTGYEIIDARLGVITFYRLHKHVFENPVTGVFKRLPNGSYQLHSHEGSDVSEFTEVRRVFRSLGDGSQDVVRRELKAIESHLRSSGWDEFASSEEEDDAGEDLMDYFKN